MKHLFTPLITLASVLLFASCAKEADWSGSLPVDKIPVTFELKTDGAATKAFGDGTTANTLLVGVYNKQVVNNNPAVTFLPDLSVTTLGEIVLTGKTGTFETTMVRGQEYILVFWAQKPGVQYYSLDFANGTLTVDPAGNANDEGRDAFYKVFETGIISETNYQFSGIELTRPFAQINVLTPNDDVANAAKSKVLFTKSAMTVSKAPKTMNLLTGGVGDLTATYTYEGAPITEAAFGSFGDTHTYIAMNYVLGDNEKALYDIDLDVYSSVCDIEQSPIHFDIDGAPAQRNYRTNIIGNVFTLDTQFNIIVNPLFGEPDYTEGLPGVEFEETTITPTLPSADDMPEGVDVTPATADAPATITFASDAGALTIAAAASSEAAVHARTSNAAVATTSVSGGNVTITPVAPGEAIVTIYTDPVLATKAIDETKNYAGAKLEFKVVVEEKEKLDVTISIDDINLKVGEGYELEPEVDPEELYLDLVITPAEGYEDYFDWDPENWIIEAKAETPEGGIAITLSYPEDDTYKAASKTIKVYISEKEVPEVEFEDIEITVDDVDDLVFAVDPEELEASVTFNEGEQEVYDVYKMGEVWKIKGLKRGSAELTLNVAETATTAPTSKTVTVTVNGKAPTFVIEDIEIEVGEILQLVKEEQFDLDSDGELSFSVDSEYAPIITVDQSGNVKGLAVGEALLTISVAATDTYKAGSDVMAVTVVPATVVEPETATITITGVPTVAQEPGATFDVEIVTNSTAALVVECSEGASIAPKTGNTYTVTCADNLTADTEVTITASVSAVENAFTAAEETATFTVKHMDVPGTGEGTATSPYDVTRALFLTQALADNGKTSEVYVQGTVVAVSDIANTYHNATYTIGETATSTAVLTVYRGMGVGGENIDDANYLLAGDVVVVKGTLENYVKNDVHTYEISTGNQISSFVSQVERPLEQAVISGVPATLTLKAGDTYNFANVASVTPTGASLSYEVTSGNGTITSTGVLTVDSNAPNNDEIVVTVSAPAVEHVCLAATPVTCTVTVSDEDLKSVTLDFMSQNYSNGDAFTSLTVTPVTATAAKGSASTAPAFYTASPTGIRVYGGGTMTVSSAQVIKKIEITGKAKNTANTLSVTVGSISANSDATVYTWTGSASSVVVTVDSSTGNYGFQNIVVYYAEGGTVEPVTLSSIAVSGQKTSFNQGDAFSFGGTVTATYSDASTKDVTGSATFSGYDMSTISDEQTVTVSYTEESVTKTTTYTIKVKDPNAGTDFSEVYTTDENVTVTGGTSASVIINNTSYNAYKYEGRTGKTIQSATITVPEGTKKIHLFIGAWNNGTASVTVEGGTIDEASLTADSGISSNSPFTLAATSTSDFYKVITLDENATSVTVTPSGERILIWGVNAD